jgi:DNA-binding NarL/FixJ family response regulator
MPGVDGITAASMILRKDPTARIVFVTIHAEPMMVENALSTGALGYVLKIEAGDELLPAVHSALAGKRYISQGLRNRCQTTGAA